MPWVWPPPPKKRPKKSSRITLPLLKLLTATMNVIHNLKLSNPLKIGFYIISPSPYYWHMTHANTYTHPETCIHPFSSPWTHTHKVTKAPSTHVLGSNNRKCQRNSNLSERICLVFQRFGLLGVSERKCDITVSKYLGLRRHYYKNETEMCICFSLGSSRCRTWDKDLRADSLFGKDRNEWERKVAKKNYTNEFVRHWSLSPLEKSGTGNSELSPLTQQWRRWKIYTTPFSHWVRVSGGDWIIPWHFFWLITCEPIRPWRPERTFRPVNMVAIKLYEMVRKPMTSYLKNVSFWSSRRGAVVNESD